MMRVFIADDEAPARERLKELLEDIAAEVPTSVAGEAKNGLEVLERLPQSGAQVLLLDIQMPGMGGLEVARHLALLPEAPTVVFVTAHDRHAVEAFELNALDYLLKPVNRARLAKAIDRVRHGRQSEQALDRASLSTPPRRFLGRRGQNYRVVPAREVLCFVSEDGLTRLQAVSGNYWVSPTLHELEARLDPRQFYRISRAAIVNLDAVRDLAPLPGGGGEVSLRDDTRLEVSRRRLHGLTERLGGT